MSTMIDCPHPQACNGVRRHHNDSGSRAACEARGKRAQQQPAPTTALSGLQKMIQSQKPESIASRTMSAVLGTTDVEITNIKHENRRMLVTLADQNGDDVVEMDVDTNLSNDPTYLRDVHTGDDLSVAAAADLLDQGGDPVVAHQISSSPGLVFDRESGRRIATDGTVFYRRGRNHWASLDSDALLDHNGVRKAHGVMFDDVGEGIEGALRVASETVLANGGESAAKHYAEIKDDFKKSQIARAAGLLPQLNERELRARTSNAIYNDASSARFGYYPEEVARTDMHSHECRRRDAAEHDEGCSAIGNRYSEAHGDAMQDAGYKRTAPRPCTCGRDQS